jgi:uncharacterized membrane protein YbhN (UPF0104 family)
MTDRATYLSIITFLGVIIGVQFTWGWDSLFAVWQRLPLTHIIVFITIYWVTYGIRTARIATYFKVPRDRQIPLGRLMRVVVKQTFWANVLPAKTGEVSFPLLMKKNFAISYTDSVSALLVLRLFDAYVLGTIALALIVQTIAPLASLIWLIASLGLPLTAAPLRRTFIGLAYRNRRRKVAWYGWKLLRNIPVDPARLMRITLFSWLNWGLKIALFAGLLASLIQLPMTQTLLAALVGEVSGMLPGLPGGFGNYEAAVSFGLMPYMPQESTGIMIAAALNAHLFILFNSVLGAFIAYILPSSTR